MSLEGRKVTVHDMSLRDGMHPKRHQITVQQMRDVARGLDEAGVPLIEVTHGDGLGGASVNYGFPAASDEEYLRAAGHVDTEVNVQLGEYSLKKNMLQPLPPAFSTDGDFVTVFGVSMNANPIQCVEVQASTHRQWLRLVGQRHDVQLWDADSRLPQPPFECKADMSNSTGSDWFDGRVLALYLTSSGHFAHPTSRRPLQRAECVALDEHVRRHRLGSSFEVARAFDLQSDMARTGAAPSEELAATRRAQAAELRAALFTHSGSQHHGPTPPAPRQQHPATQLLIGQ